VDNAVAVYGGALAFTRPGFARKPGMDGIRGFKSVRFLVIDSKVPRDTKSLVAGVGKRKIEEPLIIEPLLEAIQSISDEARRALTDVDLPRSTLLSGLAALIDENHAHLATMGVSHPVLEIIRAKTAAAPYHLHTKLTGAGGGGCLVTLVPDGFPDQLLNKLMSELEEDGFETHFTNVGGSGLGVFSPRPSREAEVVATEGGDEAMEVPLRTAFLQTERDQLSDWVSSRGRWLYV